MIICKTHGKNWIKGKLFSQVLEKAKTAEHLIDISHTIHSFLEANGFSIVRGYVGHSGRSYLIVGGFIGPNRSYSANRTICSSY